MSKSRKGKKKNFPNGCYTNEDWIKLVINEDKFDNYKRKFSTGNNGSKCPPVDLTEDGACYYCLSCQNNCASYVKEYKNHYLIKNQKYIKSNISNGDD